MGKTDKEKIKEGLSSAKPTKVKTNMLKKKKTKKKKIKKTYSSSKSGY